MACLEWYITEKVLKKGEYIAIKCHNTPGDNDSGSYEINFHYYGGGSPEEWRVWNGILLEVLDGQSISMGPQRYMFAARILTGDAKLTFSLAALDIAIHTVNNFNKALAEMTKHVFLAYAFCEQKRYLRRHLNKLRSMKLRSFLSSLQELNAYLAEFPLDTEIKKPRLLLQMKSWTSSTIPYPPCRKTRSLNKFSFM